MLIVRCSVYSQIGQKIMHRNIAILSLAFSGVQLVGCKTSDRYSATKDIGLQNTVQGKSAVVYENQGRVYIRVCKSVQASPSRTCEAEGREGSLALNEYISRLPYDIGQYHRTDEDLAFLTRAVNDSRLARGNPSAAETARDLEPKRANLETILKIRDSLKVQNHDLTYYNYQDEFKKVLYPFEQGADLPDYDAQFPVPRMEKGTTLTLSKQIEIPAGAVAFNFYYDRRKRCSLWLINKSESPISVPAGEKLALTGNFNVPALVSEDLITEGTNAPYSWPLTVRGSKYFSRVSCQMAPSRAAEFQSFQTEQFKSYFSSIGTWSVERN
jgi:hypothetical protein